MAADVEKLPLALARGWRRAHRSPIWRAMRSMRLPLVVMLAAMLPIGCESESSAHAANHAAAAKIPANGRAFSDQANATNPASYSWTDERGIPRYFRGDLAPEARGLLRRAYGALLPSHLYISDSTRDGLLKYDPEPKRCSTCYVNSYRIGFI